jgi:S-adenosyl-L-methionine hydrolase (adenosine-forming)
MHIVTLTTDFGLSDAYVGAMKGVILSIAPHVTIVDICHEVPAQDVVAGGMTLAAAWRYFPAGTIHVAVVDPGVGTPRRPLALQWAGHFFVGPDNGLLSLIWQEPQRGAGVTVVHLTRPAFWITDPSPTFHGRDIFAPVAAHLANGCALASLGDSIAAEALVRLRLRDVERCGDEITGEVVQVDHFGNLITSIAAVVLQHPVSAIVTVAGRSTSGLKRTYGDGAHDEIVALVSSGGYVEIAVVNGSAAKVLGVGVGAPVRVLDRI